MREKIIEYFESLTPVKKLMLLFLILIILFVFYMSFIKNNYRNADIDYTNLDSSKIIEYSTVIYDRNQVYAIDEVIDNFLKIKDQTWIIEKSPITLKNLYSQTVTQNLKKKFSNRKFRALMESVYTKVLGSDGKYNSNYNYIDTVYYSAEYDTYLVKLVTINSEDNAYIGIRITNGSYSITYVE